jgi:hypothetical protein
LALTRFVDDVQLPADTDRKPDPAHCQRALKLAVYRQLASGSAGSGSYESDPVERMIGHDLYAYPKDVLTRVPTHRSSRIQDALAALLANRRHLIVSHDRQWRSTWVRSALTERTRSSTAEAVITEIFACHSNRTTGSGGRPVNRGLPLD